MKSHAIARMKNMKNIRDMKTTSMWEMSVFTQMGQGTSFTANKLNRNSEYITSKFLEEIVQSHIRTARTKKTARLTLVIYQRKR